MGVADEAALEEVRLGEHLEAVADAEHGHAPVRGIHDLGHDRAERGDRAAAQVVAVAEAAGQDERVDALEVVRAVPERDGLGAGEAHGALGVAVVERAGEGDDPDAHVGRPQWVSPAGAT